MSINSKSIPLANLAINIENPRFDLVGNQREATQVMIQSQGDKLINLAKDIVEIGMLNPGELINVTPHPKDKGQYIVLEGNRRVTALKILSNPGLIENNAVNKSFLNKLKPLAEEFKKKKIIDIPCVVFVDPEAANRWIKLRHTGENDGVGTVRWDAQQVGRFDERIEGNSPIALQAIDFLNNNQAVPANVKQQLKNVPSSSLDRLLRDKNVQQVLGISIIENRLQTHLKKEEVTKGLTKIVQDLASKNIKVKDIYTKEDREKYIEGFKPSQIPDKTKKTPAAWELISPPGSKGATPIKKAKSKPLSTDRESLIPRDCIISIQEPRINKIYRELKNIDVNLYENAVGVLFRVFIELSIDSFIDKHKVPGISDRDKLSRKVVEVSSFMEINNMVPKNTHKGIRNAVSNQHSILSMETFNAYVHNRHLSPVAKELKLSWDNMQIFVVKIWENI